MTRCAPPTKALWVPTRAHAPSAEIGRTCVAGALFCLAAVRPAMVGRLECAATWHRVARCAAWCCERSRARADVVGACTRGVEVGCACACCASCSHSLCCVCGQ